MQKNKKICLTLICFLFFLLFPNDLLYKNLQFHTPKYDNTTTAAESYDYIIITTEAINNSGVLNDFLCFKSLCGYKQKIFTIETIIKNYNGIDNAEKIRNFLIDSYQKYGVKYLLLIGDPYNASDKTTLNTGGLIPMRYCYPDPSNHNFDGAVPTDYYYADLTGNWDSDKDNFFGEYKQDSVDFINEIVVGRIPFDDPQTIKDILKKSMEFEQKSDESKKKILLAGAIKNHPRSGSTCKTNDSATLMEKIWNNLLSTSGFSRITLYEKDGVDKSSYNCDFPLNRNNLINQLTNNEFGIVLIDTAHGNINNLSYTVWNKDTNNNGFTEDSEVSWFDLLTEEDTENTEFNSTSIYIIGSYEPSSPDWKEGECLSKLLLKNPASAVIGASRNYWFTCGWGNEKDGGSDSIFYYLFKSLSEGGNLGESLYTSLQYFSKNFMFENWGSHTYVDLFGFACYYGDPSIGLKKVSTTANYLITTNIFPYTSGTITVDPLSSTYSAGTVITLTAVPYSGYHFVNWSGDIVSTDNPIKIRMDSNKTVTANFAINTYTITASAGIGGLVSPYGTVTVNYGEAKTFTILPNSGYKIKDVKVDGISFGAITSYNFTFITSNHTIEAIFEKEVTEIIIILHIGSSSFTVNNEVKYLDSPPIIKNGRTILPIRAIVESLGGTVTWNESKKSVDIVLGNNHLILQIGNYNAYVNGVQKFIDPSNLKVCPEIVNGRTMLPLRFVAENLGCTVEWDNVTKTITITYTGY